MPGGGEVPEPVRKPVSEPLSVFEPVPVSDLNMYLNLHPDLSRKLFPNLYQNLNSSPNPDPNPKCVPYPKPSPNPSLNSSPNQLDRTSNFFCKICWFFLALCSLNSFWNAVLEASHLQLIISPESSFVSGTGCCAGIGVAGGWNVGSGHHLSQGAGGARRHAYPPQPGLCIWNAWISTSLWAVPFSPSFMLSHNLPSPPQFSSLNVFWIFFRKLRNLEVFFKKNVTTGSPQSV